MNRFNNWILRVALGGLIAMLTLVTEAGELLRGDVLANFRDTSGWSVVDTVRAVPGKTQMELTPFSGEGPGVLSNGVRKNKAGYLTTHTLFGDVSLHLEFMVPKGSNAGVYLMGRYEIQIFDSYGVSTPSFSDLGGVYQRWDKTRAGKNKGFEGIAPRVNAANAPGEWQSMDLEFRAPRFDANGHKIANAQFVSVHVNGQLVQKNAEVSGPTRGNPLDGEVAMGPIAIQGNHGPLAIRSFVVTAQTCHEAGVDDAAWIDLFDGKSLSGWTVHQGKGGDDQALPMNQIFTVRDGSIHVYAGAPNGSKQYSANLRTYEVFSHFRLQVQYRWLTKKFQPRADVNRDAGILFHLHGPLDRVWPPAVEMQLGDGHPGENYVAGDLFVLQNTRAASPSEETSKRYQPGSPLLIRGKGTKNKNGNRTSVSAENPRGEWNWAELVVRGSQKAEYYLNGRLVNEVHQIQQDDGNGNWLPLESGPISLQAEWAELEYRTIRIQKL